MIPPVVQPGDVFQRVRMPNAAGIVGKTSRIASVSGDLAQLEWFDVATVPSLITVANEQTDQTCFPAFFNAATGDLAPKTNTGLTFNALTGAFGAASFVGPLTGNVTGNISGSSGSCTGNASTVTTNANLTGHVTSIGNAAVLGSFTKAQLDAAVSDDNVAYLGQSQTFVGNQAVTGNITASGNMFAGTAIDFVGMYAATKTIAAYSNSLGMSYQFIGDSTSSGGPAILRMGAQGSYAWTSTNRSDAGITDTTLSRQSAGILQIGTTSNNALGSLACSNITASGTGTFQSSSASVVELLILRNTTAGGNAGNGSEMTFRDGDTNKVANVTSVFDGSSWVMRIGTYANEQTMTFKSGNVLIGSTTDNGSKLQVTGNITASADLICSTSGKGLQLKSGTGARAGNATLAAGTVTVTNTTVSTNTVVYLTRKTSGGTIGTSITYTLSAGASFTINSDNPLDTSTFSYVLIEVN